LTLSKASMASTRRCDRRTLMLKEAARQRERGGPEPERGEGGWERLRERGGEKARETRERKGEGGAKLKQDPRRREREREGFFSKC
jgi:hypothetical protein